MTPLTHWNPFQELSEVQNRLATLFGRAPVNNKGSQEEAITVAEWAPLVDITEDEKEFLIKAELPGLKKEEVKVTVEDGVLTMSGERKTEKEEKGKKYHRIERAYGSFIRSFTLPEGADPAKVNAEFHEGILNVHVTKCPRTMPKAIEIK